MSQSNVREVREPLRVGGRVFGWATVLVGMVGIPACSTLLWDDRCGVESREVSVSARFPETEDANAGYVQMVLLERNREAPERSVWWVLMSGSLKGHIVRARLLDTTPGSPPRSLFDLPVEKGVGDEALRGHPWAFGFPIPFDEFFALLRNNAVTLELETNLAGRELLRQGLRVSGYHDWSKPHCS